MIYWLVQSDADLPAGTDWLTPAEASRLATLRFPKRRHDWLLGRWTAKRLLQDVIAQTELIHAPLSELEIATCPDGAPLARWTPPAGPRRQFTLSLSHSGDSAFGALILGQAAALGADLERIAPRPEAFSAAYFTDAELAQVDCAPARLHDQLITGLWSAKEAALKAVRLGLTVDTRAVECRLAPPSTALASWATFSVRWDAQRVPRPLPALQGWWRLAGDFVVTVAAPAAASVGVTL